MPYNGAFTFTRIRYGGGGFRRGGSSWAHDYPQADQHLPKIIQYVSTIPINLDASNVYDLDDPEIFRHPIIYLSEPGNESFVPIPMSDEAFKLGVNYILYALTH